MENGRWKMENGKWSEILVYTYLCSLHAFAENGIGEGKDRETEDRLGEMPTDSRSCTNDVAVQNDYNY
jgi:hypothetical protein